MKNLEEKENQGNEKFKREKKILRFFKEKFSWITYVFLALVIWINVKIRTLPMQINPVTGNPYLWDVTRNNWTLGPDLDPFYFLRMAKLLVFQGGIPAIDYMRYVPLGHNTLMETKLLPNAIASLYKILHAFSDKITIEYAAVILPVISSIFMVVGFFLLVRKIFEFKGKTVSNSIALLASLFLVTLPSLLTRTIAGIPEKESLGFTLMFFAFYFFIWAWKSKRRFGPLVLGGIAGIFTALMALIWGGAIYVFAAIGVAGLVALVLGKVGKRKLIAYSSWIIFSSVLWLPFTLRTTFRQFLTSPTTGGAIVVWVFLLINFLIYGTKIKEMRIFKKVPRLVTVFLVSVILFGLVGTLFLGPRTVFDFGTGVVSKLTTPYTDRLSYTVAENKQPFFSDWKGNFGPLFGGIPLFFVLFFVGSLSIFYSAIKKIPRKKWVLFFSYLVFLVALIFSRISPNSILNGTNLISNFVYFSGYLILFFGAMYCLHANKDNNGFNRIRFEYVLIFSLVFVAIIAARSGIRLIMLLAPIAVIPISYIAVVGVSDVFSKKKDLAKLFAVVFGILLVLAIPYTLYYNYNVSVSTAKNHVPTSYTTQWQEAMGWVRENTPEDAVFGSWWDYGYWIQTMGERATMLDGGNSISYWDYLMGRHVLTAESEEEAIELLYNHNVTHFLIDSTDIGKYSAYSSIGSDENYDRFSWIGTFVVDNSLEQETHNQTSKIYTGGAVLDEDLKIEEGGDVLFFPQQVAGVGALVISINTENGEFLQPSAIIVYKGQNYHVDLKYLYHNRGVLEFEDGIEAGIYLIPSLVQQSSGGYNVDSIGAA